MTPTKTPNLLHNNTSSGTPVGNGIDNRRLTVTRRGDENRGGGVDSSRHRRCRWWWGRDAHNWNPGRDTVRRDRRGSRPSGSGVSALPLWSSCGSRSRGVGRRVVPFGGRSGYRSGWSREPSSPLKRWGFPQTVWVQGSGTQNFDRHHVS